MSLHLSSAAIPHNGEIPAEYTCDGADISPALEWSGVPAGTRSLVLIVDDPDATTPQEPTRVWVHWTLYNLPPAGTGLAKGVEPHDLPPGTLQGRNNWGRTGYGGPCPPSGRHRYFFKLYALDTALPDLGEPAKAGLLRSMEGHVLDRAEFVGTYQRVR